MTKITDNPDGVSIFGLEAFLEAADLIVGMERNNTRITPQRLGRVGECLLTVRLSDHPYNYEVRSLEERYDNLKGGFVQH